MSAAFKIYEQDRGGMVPIEEASAGSLDYWQRRISNDLDEGKAQKPDFERRRVAAIQAELQRRGGKGGVAAAPAVRSNAIVKVDALLVGQTYRDPGAGTAAIAKLLESSNVIAPATIVSSLPIGCGLAFSVVTIDVKDCYECDGGKFGITANNFHQIASAMGASFMEPRRLDDGKDAHYARYGIVAIYKDFGGQWQQRPGEYELDLRDTSERVQEQLEKIAAATEDKRREVEAKAKKAIRQMRKFIVQRAVTGAQTAALVKAGVKRSYTKDELRKPFVIARLVVDGHTDDPQLKPILAMEVMRHHLGGIGTLYGQQQAPSFMAPPAHAALPAASVVDARADDDESEEEEQEEDEREPVLLPDRDSTPVHEADDALLQRYRRRTEEDIADGPPPEELPAMRALLDAIDAELARRALSTAKGGY